MPEKVISLDQLSDGMIIDNNQLTFIFWLQMLHMGFKINTQHHQLNENILVCLVVMFCSSFHVQSISEKFSKNGALNELKVKQMYAFPGKSKLKVWDYFGFYKIKDGLPNIQMLDMKYAVYRHIIMTMYELKLELQKLRSIFLLIINF